jgi:hypothetical protein
LILAAILFHFASRARCKPLLDAQELTEEKREVDAQLEKSQMPRAISVAGVMGPLPFLSTWNQGTKILGFAGSQVGVRKKAPSLNSTLFAAMRRASVYRRHWSCRGGTATHSGSDRSGKPKRTWLAHIGPKGWCGNKVSKPTAENGAPNRSIGVKADVAGSPNVTGPHFNGNAAGL